MKSFNINKLKQDLPHIIEICNLSKNRWHMPVVFSPFYFTFFFMIFDMASIFGGREPNNADIIFGGFIDFIFAAFFTLLTVGLSYLGFSFFKNKYPSLPTDFFEDGYNPFVISKCNKISKNISKEHLPLIQYLELKTRYVKDTSEEKMISYCLQYYISNLHIDDFIQQEVYLKNLIDTKFKSDTKDVLIQSVCSKLIYSLDKVKHLEYKNLIIRYIDLVKDKKTQQGYLNEFLEILKSYQEEDFNINKEINESKKEIKEIFNLYDNKKSVNKPKTISQI